MSSPADDVIKEPGFVRYYKKDITKDYSWERKGNWGQEKKKNNI